MAHPHYIGCDAPASDLGGGYKYCPSNNVYTLAQIQEEFAVANALSMDDVHFLGGQLILVCILAYGGKKVVQALWFS
jgi:hypothetical protein